VNLGTGPGIAPVLPGTRVERIKHKMAGDFVRAYRVTANSII